MPEGEVPPQDIPEKRKPRVRPVRQVINYARNLIKSYIRPQRQEPEISSNQENINQELVTEAVTKIKSGVSIYSLLGSDEHANPETRREITREWITLMSGEPRSDLNSMKYSEGDLARNSFHDTWRDLYHKLGREGKLNEGEVRPPSDGGEYVPKGYTGWKAEESAILIEADARTSGFLKAITYAFKEAADRGDPIRTACDAGTGSTALLALALAANGATQVDAYELNPQAAAVAEQWIDTLGFGEAITIKAKDITKEDPPEKPYDLAVSEMFHAALTNENGPYVLHLLSKRAKRIFPDRAEIFARYRFPEAKGADLNNLDWQHAGTVRFAELDYSTRDEYGRSPARVTGEFTSNDPWIGERSFWLAAKYYYGDQPVLDTIGADEITHPVRFGPQWFEDDSQSHPVRIGFSYPPGIALSPHSKNVVDLRSGAKTWVITQKE